MENESRLSDLLRRWMNRFDAYITRREARDAELTAVLDSTDPDIVARTRLARNQFLAWLTAGVWSDETLKTRNQLLFLAVISIGVTRLGITPAELFNIPVPREDLQNVLFALLLYVLYLFLTRGVTDVTRHMLIRPEGRVIIRNGDGIALLCFGTLAARIGFDWLFPCLLAVYAMPNGSLSFLFRG